MNDNRNSRIYAAYIDDIRVHGAPNWERISDNLPDIDLSLRRMRYEASKIRQEKHGDVDLSDFYTSIHGPTERISPKARENVQLSVEGMRATATSKSTRITTLEQLLDVAEVNLDLWKVARYIINKWEVGAKNDEGGVLVEPLFQVKAWLEPREQYPIMQALRDLIEDVKTYSPVYDPPAPLSTTGGYLFVPNIYDAHIGKRAPSGSMPEDIGNDFIGAANKLASVAANDNRTIERILFPVGNDILHMDTLRDTTTRGTWVEVAADLRDAVDVVCRCVPEAALRLAAVAPVDIIPVESNHDRVQVHWLGQVLAARFHDHPYIHVRTRRSERQYYRWGKVGLGLTHEPHKPIDLANVMAVEARDMWAKIRWTEWLTGHLHRAQGALYAIDTVRGTVVRTIPALCDIDTYHKLHMFVGNHRAAEGLFYHREHGPAGGYPVFID